MRLYSDATYADPTMQDGIPLPRRYGAIAAIALGVSLSVLDGTIANVALPTIAGDLRISPASSIWVVNAYQLAIVVSLLALSSLGDLIGYRKIYLGGLIVFTLASLGCVLSRSLAELTVARTVQGFGAAAVSSVNTALIRVIYPRRYLGRGMGINALVVAVSAAAGPTVAAGVLSVAPWPWLFAVNLPLGLLAILLGRRFLPRNPVEAHGRKFDWTSAVMNAWTFGLLIASIEGYAHGLDARHIVPGAVAALVLGYFFVRRQLHRPYPLLPVDLFRIPIFSMSIATSVCSFTAQMLAMVSLPSCSRFAGAARSIPFAAHGMAVAIIFVARWPVCVERVHAGVLGGIGLFVFSVGLFSLAFLPEEISDGGILWRMALCGAGFGLFQSPNNSLIISSAPPGRSGGASGMLATARLVGQTTGAALVALLFHLFADNGATVCLTIAGSVAATGAVVSSIRISQPLPEALSRKGSGA
ncbi:MAG: MFS transporter [Alistipes ihumii]